MKIKIKIINNIWSQLFSGYNVVNKFLSYEDEIWLKNRFGKKKKKFRKMMINKNGYFLTGFVSEIKRRFHKDFKIIIDDNNNSLGKLRIKPCFVFNGYTLKEHQIDLVLSGLQKHRGILKAPTGSGKTLVAASLIHSIPEVRCLFLVHSKSLFSQVVQDFSYYFNEKIGFYGASLKPDIKRITVAMVNSLARLNKNVLKAISDKFDMVIVDEVHHVISNSYFYVLSHLNCYYRFGVSATPKEETGKEKDYKLAVGLLGNIINEVKITDIPEMLAKPYCELIHYPQNPRLDGLNWNEAYLEGIVYNEYRNKSILEYIQNHPDESILITIKLKEHGEILSHLIPGAILIFGKDSMKIRDEIKNLLNLKKTKVVISTVFGEGVNIPELNTIIRAEGGFSEIKTIQSAGRSLRKTSNKNVGKVVDFWDEENKYLSRHFYFRRKTYLKNNYEIKEIFSETKKERILL